MVENRVHQVFVGRAVDLHQDVVFARNKMALGNLRNLFQVFDRLDGFCRVGVPDADDGSDVIAPHLRVDLEARTENHSRLFQLFYALMNCSP